MALNILVVDDSSITRAMIIKTLKIAGLPLGEIHQAANGQEGLDKLQDNWIDLALVDINMPVMDGEEMICKVRARTEWENLPIVVVSTEGSQTRIERLQRKGAQFIHKPFSPETIGEVVSDITGLDNEPIEADTDF
ncbi:MAG: response regulator [Planctomycetes bacterium]|jgi:two-component system chemotaxis response regulator CheY|nr:response regulator [Phycisphaerae bacterium]NBB95532.1 response regulator [Planctomycetota bacterium]